MHVVDISLSNLHPTCASSCLAFCKMYSAYKLNKQCDNIQPWHTLFPIWNQSRLYCYFLICIQVLQEASKVAWYYHLVKDFSQFTVIYTVKGFSIFNEAKVDVFLEFSSFFSIFQWMLAIWSLVPLPFLNPWNFLGRNTEVICHFLLQEGGSSWLTDWTQVSHIAGRLFTIWANREACVFWAENVYEKEVLQYYWKPE